MLIAGCFTPNVVELLFWTGIQLLVPASLHSQYFTDTRVHTKITSPWIPVALATILALRIWRRSGTHSHFDFTVIFPHSRLGPMGEYLTCIFRNGLYSSYIKFDIWTLYLQVNVECWHLFREWDHIQCCEIFEYAQWTLCLKEDCLLNTLSQCTSYVSGV